MLCESVFCVRRFLNKITHSLYMCSVLFQFIPLRSAKFGWTWSRYHFGNASMQLQHKIIFHKKKIVGEQLESSNRKLSVLFIMQIIFVFIIRRMSLMLDAMKLLWLTHFSCALICGSWEILTFRWAGHHFISVYTFIAFVLSTCIYVCVFVGLGASTLFPLHFVSLNFWYTLLRRLKCSCIHVAKSWSFQNSFFQRICIEVMRCHSQLNFSFCSLK